MAATLTRRVEVLETQVTAIASLPDRTTAVEVQMGLLRTEMRDEFVNVRTEIEETRRYMRVLHEAVIDRIKTLGEGLDRRP